MIRYVTFGLALALVAGPLAAEPRIDLAVTGSHIDLTLTDATPAEALASLAATAGFTIEGAETLPTAPMSLHVEGSMERVIALLTDPVNRVATYASDNSMVRLVLLSDKARPIVSVQSAAAPADLPPGDPALGGSRTSATSLRAQLQQTLGLKLP